MDDSAKLKVDRYVITSYYNVIDKVKPFLQALHLFLILVIGAMVKVIISFKIDSWIKTALQKLAQAENRSLSNYVATLLLDHLKAKGIKPPRKSK